MDRPSYRPSGRFNAPWLMFWFVIVALPIALAVGFLLCKVFRWGWYLIGIAPLIAGGLTCAGVALAVRFGHCRNRWVGAGLGLVAAAVMYLSYYQFDFAHLVGFQNVHRVEVLPHWIYFRILTDEQKEVGAPDRQVVHQEIGAPARPAGAQAPVFNDPDPVKQAFKWVFFAMDCVLAMLAPIGVGWACATRPYSERYRRWMTSFSARVTPASADAVLAALNTGRSQGLGQQVQTISTATTDPSAELRLDYLPDMADAPVYLTVTRVFFVGKNKPPRQQVEVSRIELTPEEIDALTAAVKLPRTGEAARPLPAGLAADHLSGLVAPLPAGEAGKVYNRTQAWVSTLLQLAPLLLALACAVGFGWLAYARWDEWDPVQLAAAITVAVMGPVTMITYLMRYEHYLPTVYNHRRLMAALRGRPDSYVDADDPDAVFVDVIPRANWPRIMVRNSTDVGLVKVDRRRRAILFEGDQERWALPAESIISCAVEEYTEGAMEENRHNLHAVVVLVANVDGKTWEAPLRPRATEFRPWLREVRRERAAQLHAAISSILPDRSDKVFGKRDE